jgi:AraC family transcriptional regulator, regulatory protein of adaptative response / DNA-3-methyladenine glycosylase II
MSRSELVCRAVRMILAGALDQGDEARLAARLGLSGRHLRRMFLTHLGVTPDGLARSCRTHFARRLLDDTDVSVTEIAYMAGFGSVRQFNRDCLQIFRATPSELRAGHCSPERGAADGGLMLRLWFTGPLDWDALTSFLAERAVPGVEDVDGRTYRRTIMVEGDPGLLELDLGGRDHLLLRLHLPHWAALTHLTAKVRRIASLDEDLGAPTRSLRADPLIEPFLARRPGIRIPGSWDPFEVGVAAIFSQGLSAKESREVIRRLVGRFGDPAPGLASFRLTHTFPNSRTLANAGPELEAIGLSRHQAQTIAAYASAVERDMIRFDDSISGDQLISSIKEIPGVTASTAEYIALRMGEPDTFPIDDPVLQGRLSKSPAGSALH